MVDGWEWDPTLFLGSARYYPRGRLPYAPGLPELMAAVLPPGGGARLLDLGCGPGTLSLPLAPLFDQVVGVDPDRDMLDQASRRAAEAGRSTRMRWIRARAEELTDPQLDLGTFRAAAFGQSFHWMDRDAVAAIVLDLLEPGGVLLHVSDLKTEQRTTHGLPCPAVPYPAVDELVRRYLGQDRRAGRGVLPRGTPDGEAGILARAGFAGPRRHVLPGGEALERSREDVAAWVFSLSSSAPHLFDTRLEAFAADLDRLLLDTSPSGLFSERVPSTEVFVWRKP